MGWVIACPGQAWFLERMDVVNYVALSGGADSVATALLLKEQGVEFELVFSDTGVELPETYWVLPRVVKETVGDIKKLHVVSSGGFFQHLVDNGWMLPSMQVRWCTRILKQRNQNAFFKSTEPEWVAVGIRADEAHRADLKPVGDWEYVYPLVEAGMGRRDVEELCKKYGLLSPVYEWRTNTSCFCCPFQRKRDWLGLLKHHPDLYALAEDWENISLEMAQERGWVAFGWNQGWRLQELREADAAQLRLFPEPEGEACTICAW